MKAEVLTIGNELLFGETVDTNSSWIARELTGAGVQVSWKTTVGDTDAAILDALSTAIARADLIVTTGGLGPTDDDITRHSIAKAFGRKLVYREDLEGELKAFFKKRKYPFTESNLIQLYLPEGSEAVHNPVGTAFGIRVRHQEKVFYALPGVPLEMKAMMTETVLPQVRQQGKTVIHRTLHTAGIGESTLFDKLKGKYESGNVKVAYLPDATGVNIRLSAGPANEKEARSAVRQLEEQIIPVIKPYLYGTDDETLEQSVGKHLSEKKRCLSTAESCTGGLLAERITSVPGSSAYFSGGWVTYSNEEKVRNLDVRKELFETHGAVSPEVAAAMAEGAVKNAGTDYGIGISGIAGPGGGTTDKPVGTVCIALAGPSGTESKQFFFGGNRQTVRIRSVTKALFMLFTALQNE